METVIAVARNIVMLIFLAAVLEILLPPKSSMGRYLQLIMGLFVVVAVLSPALDWMDKGIELETLAFIQEPAISQKVVLQKGEEMQRENQRLIIETTLAKMSKQIEALTKLVPGVEKVKVDISVDNNFIETGLINLVKIEAWREKQSGEYGTKIEPVKVSLTNSATEEASAVAPEALEKRIKETVSNFFSLNPQQIEIIVY